jgi:malonate-semialdehyde dehydrogenase (acetylating)/methylmalonate-semialdehyde dehydrogenase
MSERIENLIGGKRVSPAKGEVKTIVNPADGKTVLGEVRFSGKEDVNQAVAAAKEAFKAWKAMPMIRRCRILFHCKELFEQRQDEVARCLVRENGKTMAESQAEVRRGIEVIEFAAGMTSLAKGDFFEDIAGDVDGYMYREPLGVVTGACPFNFPAMIPMWMFPVALACGNTFILKPTEKCPMTANLIARIMMEGGIPPGVLSVVHGGRETFEALIEHPDVAAISFVGSTPVAKAVWNKAAACGKRVQALGGAKNYLIVMPDADREATLDALIGSCCGCAGQRCMATSVLMLVGETGDFLEQLTARAKKLKLGDGLKTDTGMGPLNSKELQQRVLSYIETGITEGAKLILDGRAAKADGLPDGYFVGPTIFDGVTPEMKIGREEIFGPVLSVMRAPNLDKAIEMANTSTFGNGASIFTNSGAAARKFRSRIECGMLGINMGVPAPMAFISFGGFKGSLFGDLKVQGTESIEFYTRRKAVIERWFGGGDVWGK